jgi:hypothetical protein
MAKKTNEMEVTVAEVVDYMRITNRFSPSLREVVERKVAVEEARKRGIKVSTKELQKAADTFRLMQDLSTASDTKAWLKSNGISLESLEEYLETNLMIYKLKDKLEKETNKSKFMSTQEVKEVIRDLIYEGWLKSKLK